MIERLLALRTVAENGDSFDGAFSWPLEVGAVVECPDWDANPHRACGGGLHGLPWGVGDVSLLAPAGWPRLVVEVEIAAGVVGSEGKCRFHRCTVVHVGDEHSAAEFIIRNGGNPALVIGAVVTAGYDGTATAGYGGTIAIRWYDFDKNRYRIVAADVGENGIDSGVAYKVENGKLVRA